jgi:hypothetical protein
MFHPTGDPVTRIVFTLVSSLVFACCAIDLPQEGQAQQASLTCSWPPARCYPLEDGASFCLYACGGLDAFCVDYTQTDYDWCAFHPGQNGCTPGGVPGWSSVCQKGAAPLESVAWLEAPEVALLEQRVVVGGSWCQDWDNSR